MWLDIYIYIGVNYFVQVARWPGQMGQRRSLNTRVHTHLYRSGTSSYSAIAQLMPLRYLYLELTLIENGRAISEVIPPTYSMYS